MLAAHVAGAKSGGASSPGQLLVEQGLACLNTDDLTCAERKFRESLQLDPAMVIVYPKLAAILYKQRRFDEAVALLLRCPNRTDLDVREQLGLALFKTKTPQPTEAAGVLEGVLKERPESFAAHLQLGEYYLKTNPRRAAIALQAYLDNRPSVLAGSDRQIVTLLGTALILARDWPAAIRTFENLVRTRPADLGAKISLATAYTGANSCDKAIALYVPMLEEAPRQPSIYYNLAKCYYQLKQLDDAEREALHYSRIKTSDPKAHVLLADVRRAQGRYGEALAAYQEARRLDPDKASIALIARIGMCDLKLRNFKAALAELEAAGALAPDDLELRDAIASARKALAAQGVSATPSAPDMSP